MNHDDNNDNHDNNDNDNDGNDDNIYSWLNIQIAFQQVEILILLEIDMINDYLRGTDYHHIIIIIMIAVEFRS